MCYMRIKVILARLEGTNKKLGSGFAVHKNINNMINNRLSEGSLWNNELC